MMKNGARAATAVKEKNLSTFSVPYSAIGVQVRLTASMQPISRSSARYAAGTGRTRPSISRCRQTSASKTPSTRVMSKGRSATSGSPLKIPM